MSTASIDRIATLGTQAKDLDLSAFLAEGAMVADGGYAWIGIGPARRSASPVHGRLSIYSPDFFLRDVLPWWIFERSALVEIGALADRLADLARPIDFHWATSPMQDFAAAFADIQERITAGTLAKAVPFASRTANVDFTAPQRAWLLSNALRTIRGEALHAYGIWEANSGMVGTTPEALFAERIDAENRPGIWAMALAGTRAHHAPSLLDDPKEVHEHRIVVQGIVERLSPMASVRVGETRELELPKLVHLLTPIEAFPHRRTDFAEWVAALHPTAAIGAWPKEVGWEWLQNQPNAALRGRYGAPFGIVPPSSGEDAQGQCLVAIRNVQWEHGEARILAGGGIVAESQIEREWREFNAKMDSIQGALGL